MKGKYFIAAGLVIAGLTLWYFLKKEKEAVPGQPGTENERHHLTNAFAKAKQVAMGRQ